MKMYRLTIAALTASSIVVDRVELFLSLLILSQEELHFIDP